MATTYEPFKAFRRINNLTQTDVGNYLDVSKSFISQLETGRADIPHWMLQKLLNNDKGWDTKPLEDRAAAPVQTPEGYDLLTALKEAQAQNAKSQEQIDRLLGIIEKLQSHGAH